MHTLLRRHLLPIQAHFDFSLVLTYAFPQDILQPLLPPGLSLNTYDGFGFLALAMVQTRELRPTFLPKALGQRFFLTGYRIFVCYHTQSGRRLRGLYILRSDADQASMVILGNLLTSYGYHKAEVDCSRTDQMLTIAVKTPQAKANVQVIADLSTRPASLPTKSPFPDLRIARQFAGPLPFTFSYESETQSMLRVEGVRQNWKPEPIHVDVVQATFLHQPPFNQFSEPKLANAFYLEHIPYCWKRGVREELRTTARPLQEEGIPYA
jgi:hypothetical protein